MKKLFLSTLCLIGLATAKAQTNDDRYHDYIAEGEKAYEQKEYLKSGKAYSQAFAAWGGKGLVNDRYNAACSWALIGEVDSSFDQLQHIAKNGNYTNLSHLLTDNDLDILHNDKRWDEVVTLVRQNKEKAEVNFDKPLVAMLDSIYMEDQKYRHQLKDVEGKYGRESKELKALWNTISHADSINLIKVLSILDTRGWLGPDVVGPQGSTTLFLVIQHSDPETQRKYLPMMREAVKNKKARPSALALLEDRVALGLGKRQIYGSQIGTGPDGKNYVLPLEDPDNVDIRRKEVGLGPLADYARQFQVEWNVDAYKKQLPEIEAREKKNKQ